MSEIASAITGDTPIDTNSVVGDALKSEPKLWAGKYKSPEELEEAYKNSAKVFNENKELKDKLEQVTKAPEKYNAPEGVNLRESELREIQTIARNANLTQEQFEKTAREMAERIDSQRTALAESRKAIGDEKIAILEDYVKNYYPDKLHQSILNQLLKDSEAMKEALIHRDQLLNSRAPGMSQAGGVDNNQNKPAYDGQKELDNAAREYHKRPTTANRERYIRLAEEVGHERFKDKVGR